MARTHRLAAAAAVLSVLAVPAGASAASIGVTSNADEANPPGCSLREAVESANSNTAVGGCAAGSGADTITLGVGTYTLTLHGTDNNALTGGSGDLDVGDQGVTITGAGANKTIVDGDAADRVFDFVAGTSELRDLTVTRGKTPDGGPGAAATPVGDDSLGGSGESAEGSGPDDGDGGGIRNAGTLTLERVTVSNSQTGAGGTATPAGTAVSNPGGNGGAAVGGAGGSGGDGGGIANEGDGDLIVNDSIVSANVAGNGGEGGGGGQAGGGAVGGTSQSGSGGGGGYGGGIFDGGGPGSSLTISRSVVSGNSAGGGGNGGDGGTGGTGTSSSGAAISGHGGDGGEGGGVFVQEGSMDLSGTTIDGNSAGYGGNGGLGGTAGAGATSSGGRGGNGGAGGGLKTFADNNTIAGSAVVRNQSGYGGDGGAADLGDKRLGGDGGDAGNGGGVDIAGPTQVFSNSTVASNAANGSGNGGTAAAGSGTATPGTGGLGGSGGGVVIENGVPVVTLTHLTIASNNRGAGSTDGSGGGLYHETAPNPPVLVNTIVAGNTSDQCSGTNTDGGHSISFPDPPVAGCSATIHTDPLLGPLGAHGGLTPTMQLLPGSPAIDAAGTGFPCTATDQRGVTRPKGTACDIGAVERSLPVAVTGGTNSIGSKKAGVAGTVGPGGIGATYFFRFGRTAEYGSKTPTASAGASNASVVALATLRGLTPNAVYHYRLFVANPDGTASGIDRTFRTKAMLFPGVKILSSQTTVRDGVARIKLGCPDRTAVQEHCNGTLALSKHVKNTTVGFGRHRFSILPGHTKLVKVNVSKAGRKLLAEHGAQTVKAITRAGDARRGKPKFQARKVTLKTP